MESFLSKQLHLNPWPVTENVLGDAAHRGSEGRDDDAVYVGPWKEKIDWSVGKDWKIKLDGKSGFKFTMDF